MSADEMRRWKLLARGWVAYMVVWYAAFVILDALRPPAMYAALAGLVLLVAAAFWWRGRRRATAAVRAELKQVSKTQWKRG